MRVLSVFSGIGGLDLGLERAGMTVVGQVEIDPFCRAVLAKHWPNVKQVADVREVKGDEFGPVDLVCGGVPCQPASCAGKRKGASDERWLWGEFVRVVRDSGCTWFCAENVRGFLSLADAPGVVRDLERAGFEVRTVLLGAHHVGAPHRRDRIWIVGKLADARRGHGGRRENGTRAICAGEGVATAAGSSVAHPASGGLGADGIASGRAGHTDQRGTVVADADSCGSGQDRRASELRAEGTEQSPGYSWCGDAPEGREVTRWPSRPGEPQHEWEHPRLVYSIVSGGRIDFTIGQEEVGTAVGRAGAGGGTPREPESRVGVTTQWASPTAGWICPTKRS